ncbi:MAG TPA: hypothetical protein PLY93_15395 [Turneriella sp.]|nr:hypothetical protein [Turneriella sp.]
MKPRALFAKLWDDQFALLPQGSHATISGGGISGLHLAEALTLKGVRVTLYDLKKTGGVRIPLMRACQSEKPHSALWQRAAAFTREKFHTLPQAAFGIDVRNNWFVINTRAYLRALRTRLQEQGVVFVHAEAPSSQSDLHFNASGAGGYMSPVTRVAAGYESYWGRLKSHEETALKEKAIPHYLRSATRAALVHTEIKPIGELCQDAHRVHPHARHAIFYGERLTCRDRLPLVGFDTHTAALSYDVLREKFIREPFDVYARAQEFPFLFTAMGYHAFTYAPYLASVVAKHLTGHARDNENLVCTLTPTRFLSRKQ